MVLEDDELFPDGILKCAFCRMRRDVMMLAWWQTRADTNAPIHAASLYCCRAPCIREAETRLGFLLDMNIRPGLGAELDRIERDYSWNSVALRRMVKIVEALEAEQHGS